MGKVSSLVFFIFIFQLLLSHCRAKALLPHSLRFNAASDLIKASSLLRHLRLGLLCLRLAFGKIYYMVVFAHTPAQFHLQTTNLLKREENNLYQEN